MVTFVNCHLIFVRPCHRRNLCRAGLEMLQSTSSTKLANLAAYLTSSRLTSIYVKSSIWGRSLTCLTLIQHGMHVTIALSISRSASCYEGQLCWVKIPP
eukprot:6458524-Amphidinium_carterae.1